MVVKVCELLAVVIPTLDVHPESLSNPDKAIFAFGNDGTPFTAVSNLVTNTGVVGTDVAGVGTVRSSIAACSYGTDKGIMGFGTGIGGAKGMTNLVSNTGVVATDVTAVGTAREKLGACEYGDDKGIFAYGPTG